MIYADNQWLESLNSYILCTRKYVVLRYVDMQCINHLLVRHINHSRDAKKIFWLSLADFDC